MTENEFYEELKKLNIIVTSTQKKQLNKYYEILIEWNKKINLTGITKKKEVYLKHFYDSLTVCKIINLNQQTNLCDIGSGAGFPGLVLKIFFPNLEITLLDSLNKRIIFLEYVIEKLNLKKIHVVHARAEEYASQHRNEFDITIARAVAHLSILLEYAIPMTKKQKYFIAMKANINNEISEMNQAIIQLHTHLIKKIEFLLPIEESKRTILLFQKKYDNKKYPRSNHLIKKNRL